MGTSTNAILFYGYPLGDEDSSFEIPEDWEEVYAKAMGLELPPEPYPSREVPRTKANNYDSTPKGYTPEEQTIIDSYSAFWKAKRDLIAEKGVKIDSHCSCDYPMYYVHITKAEKNAHRGEEVEITPESLTGEAHWAEQLKDFCKVMGFEVKGEPKWYLVSMWC